MVFFLALISIENAAGNLDESFNLTQYGVHSSYILPDISETQFVSTYLSTSLLSCLSFCLSSRLSFSLFVSLFIFPCFILFVFLFFFFVIPFVFLLVFLFVSVLFSGSFPGLFSCFSYFSLLCLCSVECLEAGGNPLHHQNCNK